LLKEVFFHYVAVKKQKLLEIRSLAVEHNN
jgi:hypothetical protein